MAFQWKPGEAIRKGIRRMARKQIEKILDLMSKDEGSPEERVHEARKGFKKLRALVRLVRPEIGNKVYRRENICFRDAARPLTEVRDARILIDTLDKLVERVSEQNESKPFEVVRQQLQANEEKVAHQVLDQYKAFEKVAEAAKAALDRVKDWTDVRNRWSSVGKGLEQVYRKARQAQNEAANNPTDENLHEWRKQTKYLYHGLHVLQPRCPKNTEELIAWADQLQELLGNDHDLVVLRELLKSDPERFGGLATVEELIPLIDSLRRELQDTAFSLGPALFKTGPRTLVRRLKQEAKRTTAKAEGM